MLLLPLLSFLIVAVVIVTVVVVVVVVAVGDWGVRASLELPAIGKCSARGVCVCGCERECGEKCVFRSWGVRDLFFFFFFSSFLS